MLLDDGGAKIRLTEKETAILKYLYRAGDRIVTRDVLLSEVWGYNSGVTTHTLETHIYRLRQKIERDPSHAELLVTEVGRLQAGAVVDMAAPPITQTLDSDVDVLRTVPFFAGFSDEHLKLIAFSAESRSLPDKLLLFDEGQLLHSAYVIVSGTLKAEHRVKGTDRVMKRDIGPGVILGERALILDTRATESVRVETRTRVHADPQADVPQAAAGLSGDRGCAARPTGAQRSAGLGRARRNGAEAGGDSISFRAGATSLSDIL